MMLTDKTKKDFEKWYMHKDKYQYSIKYMEICNGRKHFMEPVEMLDAFLCSPFSMQIGVYQEFFDSVGIDLFVFMTGSKTWNIYIEGNNYDGLMIKGELFKSRPESQKAAIEKANEIYNKL